MLVFCDKIPEIINVLRRKVYFHSLIVLEFQFGTCCGTVHHGGSAWQKRAARLIVAGKQREIGRN